MALTPQVRASQVGVQSVTEATTNVEVSQTGVMVVAGHPTEFVEASQVGAQIVTVASTLLRAAQAGVIVVGRGRVSDPDMRAWPFWQDNHWFYVLRLPTDKTLVYDLTTKQWLNYGSADTVLWRAYHGTNWLGSGGLMTAYGSNVLCGDDGNGALYMLNPDSPTDDDAILGVELPRTFNRVITGQVTVRGNEYWPCYGVELMGSIGDNELGLTDITLYTSDDSGNTYADQGTISISPLDYTARVDWNTGLGSFTGPGRLFRVIDDGALQRIDYLEMSDDPEGETPGG